MSSIITAHGHKLCAVDTETTGLDYKKHDIIQIAIVPLDLHLRPDKNFLPFNMHLKPARPENAEPKALKVNRKNLSNLMAEGIDPFQAADLLEEWFEKLKLPIGRKIAIIGQNYCFDKAFITEWLGPLTYEYMFDYHYRDTMITAQYLNDRAAVHGNPPPFSSGVSLTRIARKLNIEPEGAHDALTDCLLVAECYRLMMREFVGG